jgi:RNA polymerase sigma-70 factor (ECF subfamily)
VQGADAAPGGNLDEQRKLVNAFLGALRAGDFEGLVAVLDPDISVRADAIAALAGVSAEVRGAEYWARQALTTARGARFARVALVNGTVGVVIAPRGKLFRVLSFAFADGKIAQIDVVADPARLSELDLAVLETPGT